MKIVCISDTHARHRHKDLIIGSGDILIHAGDFTERGNLPTILFGGLFDGISLINDFNDWMGEQDFKHKLVICGNHELNFDNMSPLQIQTEFLTNVKYLSQEIYEIGGYKFYGEPRLPYTGMWAFGNDHITLKRIWSNIPDDIDVLITHCPPYKMLDRANRVIGGYEHVGTPFLRDAIINHSTLKYVICGHIHEDYGKLVIEKNNGDKCTIINAAMVDENTNICGRVPHSFELPEK